MSMMPFYFGILHVYRNRRLRSSNLNVSPPRLKKHKGKSALRTEELQFRTQRFEKKILYDI